MTDPDVSSEDTPSGAQSILSADWYGWPRAVTSLADMPVGSFAPPLGGEPEDSWYRQARTYGDIPTSAQSR
jgi:hypothetical protein